MVDQSQETEALAPALCPTCGSKAVKVRGLTDNGDGMVYKVACQDCGNKWTAPIPRVPDESDTNAGEL